MLQKQARTGKVLKQEFTSRSFFSSQSLNQHEQNHSSTSATEHKEQSDWREQRDANIKTYGHTHSHSVKQYTVMGFLPTH